MIESPTPKSNKWLGLRDRETAIINLLRNLGPEGAASVRMLWEAVTEYPGDTATVQAYHKILDRLVALGKVEVVGEGESSGRLFALAPHLHNTNSATLDDIHEWLTSSLPPSEVIAKAMSAMDYFEENKSTTLKAAAEALKEEEPVELFYDMLDYYMGLLEADIEIYRHRDAATGAAELRGREIVNRLMDSYARLSFLLYRAFSVPLDVVDILDVPKAQAGQQFSVQIDRERLKEALGKRIFGDKFLMLVDVSSRRGSDSLQRMSVAGSDGSTHTGTLSLYTASAFREDIGLVVTFNNSMVYVRESNMTGQMIDYPFHSVPMTRSALDDPSHKGMVLSPVMFRGEFEGDSVYEHLAKCATDVVQWRVDLAVFGGTARALSEEGNLGMAGSFLLPPPTVHIRDGTVTLQEREFKHYNRIDSYGDFVREGVYLSRGIVEKTAARRNSGLRVFGGATKSTNLRIFSALLNWYISHGSSKRLGKPIDASWDDKRASLASDNEAMTSLVSAISDVKEIDEGKYYVTCAVVRQFHSLTDHWLPELPELPNASDFERWRSYFERMRGTVEPGGERQRHIDIADLDDDPFVWMCGNVDYGMFYVGHTAGNPPPLLPRYEFMDSFRNRTPQEAAERVTAIIQKMVEALDVSKVVIDRDHNYLTNQQKLKIIPTVVYVAHEHSKALGRQFESELKSWIVARLKDERLKQGVKLPDVVITPMSVQDYIQNYRTAVEDDLRDDPDKFLR